MCSTILEAMHIKETGQQLLASNLSPFLKIGTILASFHAFGMILVEDVSKIWADFTRQLFQHSGWAIDTYCGVSMLGIAERSSDVKTDWN